MPPGTILVADDNEDTRELLCHLLVAQGHRAICAEDGEQALHAFAEHPLDLALLDVMMPRRTGFAV